jgi:hypothetical protein
VTDAEILDGLIKKAQELLEKAAKAQVRANEFAADSELPVPFSNVQTQQAAAGGRVSIRPDQFGNTPTPSGATREYLELRGQRMGAATLDEIHAALVAGGFAFSSNNSVAAMGGLKVALGKDRGIRRLPNGSFGLWAWYPNAKRDEDKADPESEAGEGKAEDKATNAVEKTKGGKS